MAFGSGKGRMIQKRVWIIIYIYPGPNQLGFDYSHIT